MADTMNFAPEYDAPLEYMRRTREYYLALGYDNPYRWAEFAVVPFTPLTKPLAQSRIALVTTAAPFQPGKGDQGPGAPYNGAAKFYAVYSGDTAKDHDLRISHIAYDRRHTSAEDSGTWFPLPALRRAVAKGRIGEISPRFHGAPTNRSQRHTIETDAPQIVARVKQDRADAVLLVPNCPVCHQTISIVARHLEGAGIPTVIMGCARDIVELAGVPRFLFSDFPLGNSAGRPHDVASQDETLEQALRLLESATGPRTTQQSPLLWNGAPGWKSDYMNAGLLSAEEREKLRAEWEKGRAEARAVREA